MTRPKSYDSNTGKKLTIFRFFFLANNLSNEFVEKTYGFALSVRIFVRYSLSGLFNIDSPELNITYLRHTPFWKRKCFLSTVFGSCTVLGLLLIFFAATTYDQGTFLVFIALCRPEKMFNESKATPLIFVLIFHFNRIFF